MNLLLDELFGDELFDESDACLGGGELDDLLSELFFNDQ